MMRLLTMFWMLAVAFSAAVESFDGFEGQELRTLNSAVGRWSAEAGQAEILRGRGRSGNRCLKLFGGDDVTVTLRLPEPTKKASTLHFWAERWTRVQPFAFRVEALVGQEWKTVAQDDGIKIGGFDTEVTVPLVAGVQDLRMICTSKAGVMLDDVSHVIDGPMLITGVEALTPVTPLMLRTENNPVMGFAVRSKGNENPLRIDAVTCEVIGTISPESIVSLKLMAGSDEANGKFTATLGEIANPGKACRFSVEQELPAGDSHYWITATLGDGTSIDETLQIKLKGVTIDGKTYPVEKLSAAQRIGVAVRKRDDDASKAYRIPGLVRSNKGTLCAVYDIRYKHAGDLPADIDVGLSRSVDGGQTWLPMQVIMDMGRDPKFGFDGVGDPAILCDRVTGRLWVVGLWSHGNRGWHGSGPGLEPEQTAQLMMVHSDDDGATWSKPRNLTKELKHPEWRMMFNGPGAGITMRDGTLVFAAQYRSADGGATQGKPFSTIIWSKDRGATWKIGTGGKIDTTEAQVVELDDGSLLLNCRDNRGGARTVLVTKDLGATWTSHPTDRKALREPVCMGSLLRWENTKMHFFSNPDSTAAREHMTIKRSDDEGMTWPTEKQLLYDERVCFGYSCLAPVDDRHLGVLYEGGGDLFYLKIPISHIERK
jgi:sialidase-1